MLQVGARDGERKQQLYNFMDKGGREVALRPFALSSPHLAVVLDVAQTANDEPQPQVPRAWGLLNLNPAPDVPST